MANSRASRRASIATWEQDKLNEHPPTHNDSQVVLEVANAHVDAAVL